MWSLEKNINKNVNINGYTDDVGVANELAEHFKNVHCCSNDNCDAVREFVLCREKRIAADKAWQWYNLTASVLMQLQLTFFEMIDRCMRNMKKDKACGPDDLSTEHLKWSDLCTSINSYAG